MDVGPLQVGTWTSAVSLSVQLAQQQAGAANKVTGVVTRSYHGTSGPAPSVPVGIYLQTTTGASLLLATLSTNAAGSFTGYIAPAENGTLVARIVSLAGYTDADSAPARSRGHPDHRLGAERGAGRQAGVVHRRRSPRRGPARSAWTDWSAATGCRC